MRHLKYCFLWAALALFASCVKEKVDQGELAAQAAKFYYDELLHGRYDDYVAGTYQPDSIPESYRSQLVDNTVMFVEQMRAEHRGLIGVSVGHTDYEEGEETAQVFLLLTFGDGTTEQVLVPMVQHGGLWYMK